MDYKIYPPVKHIENAKNIHEKCQFLNLQPAFCSVPLPKDIFSGMPQNFFPKVIKRPGFSFCLGQASLCLSPNKPQGYALQISPNGISVNAQDLAGLCYGLNTLAQIVLQCGQNVVDCLLICDYPAIEKRGLMLDISRGRVYTREYLLNLVKLLSHLRYNVFQLYIEHTFDFKRHPEICEGSQPITAEDIIAIQECCKQNGIELQANLQSLGHFNRILTRKNHRHLSESDMFWSLSTSSEEPLRLLKELYEEYLPLFESPWLNVCMDEPYDIGKGQSAKLGKKGEELYVEYLLKIHELAANLGKKIMVFGDVICNHPKYLAKMPKDMIYLDWCYDPKPVYGTPKLFCQNKMPFWVCPGSGNWNTLFPRLDGAITNTINLVKEGIESGGNGMLFTDWNDHGAYAQPGTGYYMYTYAAAVSWHGKDPGAELVNNYADIAVSIPGYALAILSLAKIYCLPPIWSKNRSECAMALFDEPIFGNAVRGPYPPPSLKAYDLSLPEGICPVFERHSQHPLRPYFAIPCEVSDEISKIAKTVKIQVEKWDEGFIKSQMLFVINAFLLLTQKLELSRKIISQFELENINTNILLDLEDEVRLTIKRFVSLQIEYIENWQSVSKLSEIEISITYFSNIISRLDYLKNWISIQRENISQNKQVDYNFSNYETAGYTTLPTY